MHSHYAASAYHPERIPDQPSSTKRGWLKRFGSSRLPWGRAQEICPVSMFQGSTPTDLRAIEAYDEELASGKRKPQAYEQLDYHQVINHERYRHASLAKRSLFWFYLWGGGVLYFGRRCSCFLCRGSSTPTTLRKASLLGCWTYPYQTGHRHPVKLMPQPSA
ncbi:hypothetical protein [Pseudomonas zhanjiangensis]|uniref:Uncharacterized protein n=1 Tax=Pseudomonas zhanjiangensis TaxID=3239015 RepID=A0ABV3Z340_9PSED